MFYFIIQFSYDQLGKTILYTCQYTAIFSPCWKFTVGINPVICRFQSISQPHSQSNSQSISQSMNVYLYSAKTKVMSWHFPYWEGLSHTPWSIIYRDPTSTSLGSTLRQWRFNDFLPDYRVCMELVFSSNQTLAKLSAAELCVENVLAHRAGERSSLQCLQLSCWVQEIGASFIRSSSDSVLSGRQKNDWEFDLFVVSISSKDWTRVFVLPSSLWKGKSNRLENWITSQIYVVL